MKIHLNVLIDAGATTCDHCKWVMPNVGGARTGAPNQLRGQVVTATVPASCGLFDYARLPTVNAPAGGLAYQRIGACLAAQKAAAP